MAALITLTTDIRISRVNVGSVGNIELKQFNWWGVIHRPYR